MEYLYDDNYSLVVIILNMCVPWDSFPLAIAVVRWSSWANTRRKAFANFFAQAFCLVASLGRSDRIALAIILGVVFDLDRSSFANAELLPPIPVEAADAAAMADAFRFAGGFDIGTWCGVGVCVRLR